VLCVLGFCFVEEETAYGILSGLGGSEMCVRGRCVCVCACAGEKMVGEYMCSNAFVGENLTDMQA